MCIKNDFLNEKFIYLIKESFQKTDGNVFFIIEGEENND